MPDIKQLESDLVAAAKARDSIKLTVLRLLKSALKNYEIEVGHDLSPQEVMAVLQKEAKKRQDSINQYTQAGRTDLVDEESAELKIIDEYLPAKMSNDELEQIVDEAITATGATSMADMGKVMGLAMQKAGAGADGSQVQTIVKAKLSP